MENEYLNIKAIIESRRHAVEQSIRPISAAEMKGLTDDLFLYIDDPWYKMFVDVIDDPKNREFYHAMVEDRIQLLYCRENEMAVWFIPGVGKGRLEPEQLKIMKEVVEAKGG